MTCPTPPQDNPLNLVPSLYKHLHYNADCHLFHSVWQLPIVLGNIVEILLSLISILAVVYITYAGIQYITSNGDPSKTAAAKTSITNAVIGLVLSGAAYLIVDFIAGRFS